MFEREDHRPLDEKLLEDMRGVLSLKGDVALGETWLSQRCLERLYLFTKELLADHSFEEAEAALIFLSALFPRHSDFWIALGHARMGVKNIEGAIDSYEIAAGYDSLNPLPYFFLGKALASIGEVDPARSALELTVENCADEEKWSELRGEAEQLLRLLGKGFSQ